MYGNIPYFTYLCLRFQKLLFYYNLYILFMLAAMQWSGILQNQLFVFRMSYIIRVSILIEFGWIVCEIWKWAFGKKITILVSWQQCCVWISHFQIFLPDCTCVPSFVWFRLVVSETWQWALYYKLLMSQCWQQRGGQKQESTVCSNRCNTIPNFTYFGPAGQMLLFYDGLPILFMLVALKWLDIFQI